MGATKKLARQRCLLHIIRTEVVETQTQLAEKLKDSDFPVSQPTLSKDIAELGIIKVPIPNCGHRYQVSGESNSEQHQQRLHRNLREFLTHWDSADQLVVLRTIAGHAAGIAWSVDNAEWDDVLGTIAGEDTVLVVCRSADTAKDVIDTVENIQKG
jgi:transcriptional regulator of arginine metabolism